MLQGMGKGEGKSRLGCQEHRTHGQGHRLEGGDWSQEEWVLEADSFQQHVTNVPSHTSSVLCLEPGQSMATDKGSPVVPRENQPWDQGEQPTLCSVPKGPGTRSQNVAGSTAHSMEGSCLQ